MLELQSSSGLQCFFQSFLLRSKLGVGVYFFLAVPCRGCRVHLNSMNNFLDGLRRLNPSLTITKNFCFTQI